MLERLRTVLAELAPGLGLPSAPSAESIPLERPKRAEHGDWATSIALALAKAAGRPPRDIAKAIADSLPDGETIAAAEVAGPGFINLRLAGELWGRAVMDILEAAPGALRPAAPPKPERILVEFVSANPTGPLHVGHGRGAIVGDALVSLLKAAGHEVRAEYYWNDRGNQVRLLGESVAYRYRQALGIVATEPGDENWYRGEYIAEIARSLVARDGASHAERPASDPFFVGVGEERVKAWIADDLAALGVKFDSWVSERGLVEQGIVDRILADLERTGLTGKLPDGAVVFRSTELGDEKDRVLRKSSGDLTYFATDVPYHVHKLERGFQRLIDVWGGDHHGHVRRMKLALKALGNDPDAFEIVLAQMVSVTRSGQAVVQSKRAGTFVELREIVDEVGRDACRFFFLMRRTDSQLEFDIDLAKRQSLDNPVYYMQYAHARLCSILRRAKELGAPMHADRTVLGRLGSEEREIVARLADYPDVIADAARAREPHRLVFWLQELAQAFASYFTRLQKVHHDTVLPQRSQRVGDWRATWDWDKTRARLLWVDAIRRVFADALDLCGVGAPEQMEKIPPEGGGAADEEEEDGSRA